MAFATSTSYKSNMNTLMTLLKVTGICPIMAKVAPDSAVPAARALIDGGVPVVEVLMWNEDSMGNLEKIARAFPGIIVGAGTVLNVQQAERLIDLGAQFIVMPGFSRKIVELCLKMNIPVLPGCVTPTEIMMALEYDIHVVKFFPVYQMGGIEMLKQLNGGPFPNVQFVATGGLNSENFLPLMRYPNILAAGGDWMFADHNALFDKNYKQITRNIQKSVNDVLDVRTAGAAL